MNAKTTAATNTTPTRRHLTWVRRLRRFLLGFVWYVHTPVRLTIHAAPQLCLQTLALAARPSTQRLQYRNLFASGRRYQLQPRREGFRLTTTSKVLWNYRQRTRAAAVMYGTITALNESMTRIELETHTSLWNLFDVLPLPLFMSSIIMFVPWDMRVIAALVIALFGLSWVGHRYNAVFEANELIFFVEKALEELEPAQILSLQTGDSSIVNGQADFINEWEKFYRRHQND